MGDAERDAYSGHMTTGHDWNGIKELNTPVPRVLFAFLGAAFLFSLGYWYLLPSFPTRDDFARGKLGIDQRVEIEEALAQQRATTGRWREAFADAGIDEIRSDPDLMAIVEESGPALYRDNCSMCHGDDGQGGQYFPRLSDASWLWSDQPEAILKTLRVGINSTHPESRIAMMPAFGKTGVLDATEVENVVLYLRSQMNETIGSGTRASELLAVNAGEAIYQRNCVACHGANLQGNPALGAPNLVDDFWLYGSDESSLKTTIVAGRGGHMPAWEERLDLAERKILTLHVLSLSDKDAAGSTR